MTKSFYGTVFGILVGLVILITTESISQTTEDVEVRPSAGVYELIINASVSDVTVADTASISLVDAAGTVLLCQPIGPGQEMTVEVVAVPGTTVTSRAYATVDCTGDFAEGWNSAMLILGVPGAPWITVPSN